ALVLAGATYSIVRMAGSGGRRPFEMKPATEEEKQFRQIVIAASEGKLREAVRKEDGWVIGYELEVDTLELESLLQGAHRFFRDLNRFNIGVRTVEFVAITNTLRDVWGNALEDVPVLRVELEKETFEKIQWQGFDAKNFPRVADLFWA